MKKLELCNRHGETVQGYKIPAMVKRLCGSKGVIDGPVVHGEFVTPFIRVLNDRRDDVALITITAI